MTAVSPQIVPTDTVLNVEYEKTSEPGLLFVKNNKVLEDIIIDDEIVPRRKTTMEEGLHLLLASMRLFGLYFNRPPEDAGENAKGKTPKWKAYMIYAVSVVILLWINAIRMLSVFTPEDKFGLPLFIKLITVTWATQCAVSQTAFYAASRSGGLAVVFRQVLEDSCARHAKKVAAVYSGISWSLILSGSAFFVYSLFFTDGLMDSLLAPLQSFIVISNPLIPRIVMYFFTFYLLASYIFPQAMTFLLAVIFSYQFRHINEALARCLDNDQRKVSDSDIETFRQKHQEISMNISHIDDCLMFSNASAFCCQLACVIGLLYSLAFYHSLMTDPVVIVTNLFWLSLLLFGLTLTAAGGITVHHYAHKISERVHDINLLRLNGEAIGKVNVFLNRLCGEPIGFTVLGIFVIDKNTILTLLGLLITYFLLIVQLSSSSLVASPISNATLTD